jgi:hypothetical protein
MPPSHNPIFAVETKDFIPSGMVDWLNNPIPAPDAFEEGNLANISPPSKSIFPLNRESSKKSSLEQLVLLKKSLPTKPSSRNFGTYSPGHTQRCLASTLLLSNITSTHGRTSHPFAKKNDRYTQLRPRLSKLKLKNYVRPGLFILSLTLRGFPTLYPLTKNRAPSAFAPTFAISIMLVQKKLPNAFHRSDYR